MPMTDNSDMTSEQIKAGMHAMQAAIIPRIYLIMAGGDAYTALLLKVLDADGYSPDSPFSDPETEVHQGQRWIVRPKEEWKELTFTRAEVDFQRTLSRLKKRGLIKAHLVHKGTHNPKLAIWLNKEALMVRINEILNQIHQNRAE